MKIKDFCLAVITGIGIGIPVTLICMISIGGFNEIVKEFLVWTIASALFGVLSVVTFRNEKLNLIVSTILHCAGCLGITVGACAVIGYSSNFGEIMLSIAPVFLIVYAVLYGVMIISMKINARKANEALEKK